FSDAARETIGIAGVCERSDALHTLLKRRSVLFVSAIVVLTTLFRPYKNHPAIYSDGIGYHLWTQAMLEGDLSFRRYAENAESRGLNLTDASRRIYQNKYPPGGALLRLPVMAFLINRAARSRLVSTPENWASG